ncbi:hypothetical protein [Vulgatibacter incomptus]|uniref:Putative TRANSMEMBRANE PROTEIN n=1 Tax=Vulgatibacter incomptus TaxID=1391653 RepID=A0A0K1PF30_9BACT|nr:hypothetical protein [Vulgatibacter incomptus]AKU92031.1 putative TRANSMEMBRANE PROTEIN [Vulgatibacter incomptus]
MEPEAIPGSRIGYIRSHLRGDHPLGVAWANFYLLPFFANAVGSPILSLLEDAPARIPSLASLVFVILVLALRGWGAIGAWASASLHVSRDGKPVWARAAKAGIAVVLLIQVLNLARLAPELGEHVLVAFGPSPFPAFVAEPSADGKAILASGDMSDDAADAIRRALDRAPDAKTVVLSSDGGWIAAGKRVSELIAERGLSTYVESECSSACTIAFLGGVDRAVSPSAKIGFHRPRKVGGSGEVGVKNTAGRLYAAAGVSRAFIERILDTPPESVWNPSVAELLESKFVTRVVTDVESPSAESQSAAAAPAVSRESPPAPAVP